MCLEFEMYNHKWLEKSLIREFGIVSIDTYDNFEDSCIIFVPRAFSAPFAQATEQYIRKYINQDMAMSFIFPGAIEHPANDHFPNRIELSREILYGDFRYDDISAVLLPQFCVEQFEWVAENIKEDFRLHEVGTIDDCLDIDNSIFAVEFENLSDATNFKFKFGWCHMIDSEINCGDAQRKQVLFLAATKSMLRGAERVPTARSVEEHSARLRGCSRSNRWIAGDAAREIAAMERLAAFGSLRIEMTKRVREIILNEEGPIKPDDIHSLATDDMRPLATTVEAQAYLTNGVAWGLAVLVRRRLIDKLDKQGLIMRHLDGRIRRGKGSWYVSAPDNTA
jgi:hypothetical protein